ncbi:FAD-dependent monooxygenase [Microbacterium horticulturae]|uniref:FAD-dependent monooxygenase n=1 Tax=Microbacterium horticulturae TaxID=3028316 RepID=A0ABY8BWB6_9MICO|nr:FAD-dependent monooxygenase [Microbacterium sp. KACC 23027]WEG08464.1 FAD-dependent monooxygenase [Microbacterium sp. KACC 23027]
MRLDSALIVGGGPAGLVAATALARSGTRVHVVEIEPELTTRGVAVNIQNSPLRALATLGVIDEVVAHGHTTGRVNMLTADGTPIMPPLEPESLVPGYPASVELYRQTLSRILERTALDAGATVQYGTTATALEDAGATVHATLSDGTHADHDLVIGADGIHSMIRDLVFGDDAPRPLYSGQCIWRAEAERGDVPELMMLHGPHGKLGMLPLSDTRMYVYLLKAFETVPTRDQIGDVDAGLRAALAEYTGPATGVADRLLPCADFRALTSMLLPHPWYRGRVLLIGDAAHATTPHLAYGLGLAVEDGVVLAEILSAADTLAQALAAFMARRFERCRLVVENSRQISEWEQHPPPDPRLQGRLMGESMITLTQLP